MNIINSSVCLFLSTIACLAYSQKLEPSLKFGDPAPPINVMKWAKGNPVKEFQRGQVYVVEFWATWCDPCKMSMPHLNDVARRYRDRVTVISIDVWENRNGKHPNYVDEVQAFVDAKGNDMDYNVAIDRPDSAMAKTWLEASGKYGIPAAYVVTKTGKIGWMGHPLNGLEEAIEQAVAGALEQTGSELMLKQAERAEKCGELMSKFEDAMNDKEYSTAKTCLDEAARLMPASAIFLWKQRYLYLAATDHKAAHQFGEQWIGAAKDNQALLVDIPLAIVNTEWLQNRDYALAIEMLDRVIGLSEEPYLFAMNLRVKIYEISGGLGNAIKYQREIIALLDSPRYSKEMLKKAMQRLDELFGKQENTQPPNS